MKTKLILFLALLALCGSGVRATTSTIYLGPSSTIKTNGIFYNGSGNVVGAGHWCPTAVVAPITLTGCISSTSGYIDAGTTYGAQTLTISVPSGLTISSYSVGLKLTGSTTACTAGGSVVLNNSTGQTVSGSNINAQSASIAFSSITEDGNKECLIEITDLSVVVDGIAETFTREINAANGTFYSGTTANIWTSGNSLFCNKWVSSTDNPLITFYRGDTPGSGSNNIIVDSDFRIHSDTYRISVPDRYRIKGYVITGYTGAGKVYTITPNGQTAKSISTDSGKPTTIYVDGLNAVSTSFVVGGSQTGNPWIYITSFRVAVEDLVTKANTVLDELAKISVYSSVTSAKTTIASATSQADIETAINNAVDINVAFGNCNTTDPVKYLATTGANITGSDFSTDAAWKLVGYNAETGTFKLYNKAHETYMGALPSAWQTAAEATTDVSAAGVFTITATTTGAAGGVGKAVFHQPSFGSYYECIHYQTSSSIAVRWDASEKASQWDVSRVYALTYNHFKVADASDPTTEGATLIASSTDYYISGTSIVYDAPLTGLSPVTSLNSQPSDGAISTDVVVNYYYEQDATLPFVTSTINNGELDNPTWYYMQVNGLATYASGDKMLVDGSRTGLNYERWCFVGDAVYGVQIFAESKGVAYPLNIASMANNDNVQITSTSTNTRWFVSGSDLSNLVIYQKSGETTFALNQLGGTSGGGSWSWKVGLWGSGSTVKLSAASSNMPNEWAIEAVNYIPSQTVYTNANTIGWPSNAALGTLNAALMAFGNGTSYANYSALLSAWDTYQSTSDIKIPSAGFYKVYHPLSSDGTKKYVTVSGSVPTSTVTVSNEASAIWYYTGDRLIAYSNGYQVKGNASGDEVMVVGGKAVAFSKSNVSGYGFGYLNVVPTGCSPWYVSPDKTDFVLNRWSGGSHDGQQFQVEAVSSLPVTLSNIEGHGFASFYTPVGISSLPDGVKAYIASVDGDRIRFTNITDIPANTGVILYQPTYTEGAVNLTIGDASSSTTGNVLNGIVASTPLATVKTDLSATNILTMQNDGTKGLGFYRYDGTNLNGFRVFVDSNDAVGVKSFVFDFDDDDATGIVSLLEKTKEGTAIYNIAGQRLSKMQKGINIVNGKKILK